MRYERTERTVQTVKSESNRSHTDVKRELYENLLIVYNWSKYEYV